MVTVQVREQHGIDAIVRDALLIKRNERRRAKVDGEPKARSIDQYTRLKPSAAAERISAANKSDAIKPRSPSNAVI